MTSGPRERAFRFTTAAIVSALLLFADATQADERLDAATAA
jgi:hypothetical protein